MCVSASNKSVSGPSVETSGRNVGVMALRGSARRAQGVRKSPPTRRGPTTAMRTGRSLCVVTELILDHCPVIQRWFQRCLSLVLVHVHVFLLTGVVAVHTQAALLFTRMMLWPLNTCSACTCLVSACPVTGDGPVSEASLSLHSSKTRREAH